MTKMTIFSRILRGELPATFVHTDDVCGAFLALNPLAVGHVLVVPRVEADHWIDLDADIVAHLMAVAQRIGKAQQAAFHCERVGVIIAGYEVPHVHVHVIPTTSMHQFNFANAASHVSREQLEIAAQQISKHLS
jgi:histidine triad (HIT) family protein